MQLPPATQPVMTSRGQPSTRDPQGPADGTTTTTTAAAIPGHGHKLSALESLPEETRQQVFSYLTDPHDLAAVSATSSMLRRSVQVPLDSAALVASIVHAQDPAAALARALPEIRAITRLPLAVAPLRAAAMALLRLPASQRGAWQTAVSATVAHMGFAPATQARLQTFIEAIATLTAQPPQADCGIAAFQTLLDDTRGLSAATQDLLLPALAEAFWAGALGDQGYTSTRDPRVLAMFRRLLAATDTWPDARAIAVLVPLLLGMRKLYAGDLGPAMVAAMPVVDRLGPQVRPVGLEVLRRGLATAGEGVDYRLMHIETALSDYPPGVQEDAVGQVNARVHLLFRGQRL